MDMNAMETNLKKARSALENLGPMIKTQAYPVIDPMLKVLEGIFEEVEQEISMEGGSKVTSNGCNEASCSNGCKSTIAGRGRTCNGDCKGCGIDCPARGV